MFFEKLAKFADIAEVATSWSPENRLVYAVMDDNTETVKKILANNKIDWSQATIRGGIFVLSYALHSNDMTIIKELLKAGIPVNAKNADNETFLVEAIQKNNKELVKLLIKHGAKVNIRWGSNRYTPLLYAIIYTKDEELVNIILDAGAQIDAPCLKGFQPIAYAAHNGLKKVVLTLINKGVDINVRNGPDGKNTVLGDLVSDSDEFDYMAMIEYVLSLGADPHIKDGWNNMSPLDYAISKQNQDLIDLLESVTVK